MSLSPKTLVLRAARADPGRIRGSYPFLRDPAAKAWFEECIRTGARLGLQATPSLYLDGKHVPSARREALRACIDQVLGR